MNHRLLTAAVLAAIGVSPALAQTPRPAAAPTRPAGVGLDALDPMRVYVELGLRDLDDLLQRAFERDNVSPADREAVNTQLALYRLTRVDVNTLNARQRRETIAKLAGGLDKALAGMKDYRQLNQLAITIIEIGIKLESSLIEYWGEDPATQAQLRPAAEAVLKIYQKAEAELDARMQDMGAKITSPNDPRLAELDRMTANLETFRYTRQAFAQYYVAMSLDKADPRRVQLADAALEYLRGLDNADSGVQPTVRLQMGKINLVKGDHPAAVTALQSLWKDTAVTPRPAPVDISLARTFASIALMQAGDFDAADKLLAETEAWQKTNLPPTDQAGAADSLAVTKARVFWARAEKAEAPADKDKANARASEILTKLMNERPALRPLILNQLLVRLPATVDMTKLDPLLLQAMIQRGQRELSKGENETLDKDAVTKASSAAKELLGRKDKAGIDPKTLSDARILVPVFAEKLGDLKAAVAGYLDFAEAEKTANPERAVRAMDSALGLLINDLKAGRQMDEEVARLYDRALPIAILPPFNQKVLAYRWARRQQTVYRNNAEAIKFYRLVPADAPEALFAKFYLAVALRARVDDPKLNQADRQAAAKEVQSAADEVTKLAAAAVAGAQTDALRNAARSLQTQVAVLAADLAQNQGDPKRALELVKDFEERSKGLPISDNLLPEVLGIRARAHFDLGENDKASDLIVLFANARPNEGIGLVVQMKDRLTKDIDAARERSDTRELGKLLGQRAQLTGLTVDWAKRSTDPKVKEKVFDAEVIDADSKRQAAAFETDPAKRTELLNQVRTILTELRKQPRGANDALLQFYLGLTSYDLGLWQETVDNLMPLLQRRMLGDALNFRTVNGQQVAVDNEVYWEAQLKRIRAYVELAKQKNDQALMDSMKDELRKLYTYNGPNTGGEKYRAEFDKLRKDLDPTIDPNAGMNALATQPTEPQ